MKLFDADTLKALHFDNLYMLIKPFSELGRKAKRNFKVFRVDDEHKAIEYFCKLQEIIDCLTKFPEVISYTGSVLAHFEDISGIIKAGVKRYYEMHELFEIKQFIYFYKNLCKQLKAKDLTNIIPFRDFSDLYTLLDIDGQDSPNFYISTKYSDKYRQLKDKLHKTETVIENEVKQHNQRIIKELDLNCIEEIITVSRMNQKLINKLLDSKYFYIDNENFANVIFKIRRPDFIFEKEREKNQILNELETEADNIIKYLSEKIFEFKEHLILAVEETGFVDLLFAKAIFAKNYKCVIPEIIKKDSDLYFQCDQIFNIFLKSELDKLSIPYQCIDISINKKITIVTGSNMGGKTSILKTLGQISFMTQMGIPVPAKSAQVKLFDHIFFSGPITQEDRADLSSFGFEVFTLQNVINTKGKVLYLLDEFGRGTNPSEGQALAQSVMRFFAEQNNTVLITATHYTPPDSFSDYTHLQMKGLDDSFIKELKNNSSLGHIEKLKVLHKYMNYQPITVENNKQVPKSALFIAELLGLEKRIIEDAENLLKKP